MPDSPVFTAFSLPFPLPIFFLYFGMTFAKIKQLSV
jgi:hypothetical protein